MSKVVSFNGKDIPDFVRVTGITFPVLPELESRETSVPGRLGNIDNGIKFNSAPYTLDVVLTIPKGKNIYDLADELKQWLRGNDWKPSPLTFQEQPDKYVMARVSNAVDMRDMILYGEGSIEFIATDPIKRSTRESSITADTDSATVVYHGTEKAPMEIVITVKANCTNLTLLHKPSYYTVKLKGNFKTGQVVSVNTDKKIIKVGDQVAMNLLDLTSRWPMLETGKNLLELKTTTAGVTNSFKVSYKSAY